MIQKKKKGGGGVKIHPLYLPWIRACAGAFVACSFVNTYFSVPAEVFLDLLYFLEHHFTKNAIYCGSHAASLDSDARWNQTRGSTLDARIG